MTVVNGRFLRARPTGLHRTARSLLQACRDRGWQAEVLAPAGVDDPLADRTLPTLPGRLGDHAFEQISLPLAAGDSRVLSLTNTAPLGARRSVVMVHDLAPTVGPHWFVPSFRWYARLVRIAARRAERVLTVSEAVASQLEAIGVDRSRIGLVPPAVDPSFRPTDDAAVRTRLGLTRAYLVLVGWADPRKDALTASAAHLQLVGEVPHDLVLVGGGHPVFAPVRLPEATSIRRAGYVTDDELRGLLTGAAALVYPSRYEGFGLPPLEAWSCGTPAIVSDIPVLRESSRGEACYVPPGDVDRWADAMRSALTGELEAPQPPAWTWNDAAARLLQLVA